MTVVIFIIILAVLILVHEFGHFIVAKLFDIKVDEFGIGYPPRAATVFEWRNTKFTLNWLPFGGFVKIFGENGESSDPGSPDATRNFVNKPRPIQAAVLLAGVTFNLIFAWLLISAGFMFGLPTSTGAGLGNVENPELVITTVLPGSPADAAGLTGGDVITAISSFSDVPDELSPDSVSEFIAEKGGQEISISYQRGNLSGQANVVPVDGLIQDRKAIGISMDMIGTLVLPPHRALFEGARTTIDLTKLVAVGLATFIFDAVQGKSDLSQVTGPVGIVGLVGDASQLGFIYLISFTAFISINLAVINVIPFPALDGGRLLFVLIESIKRSPISPKIATTVNAVGFFLLIGLMVLVTVQDVIRLF